MAEHLLEPSSIHLDLIELPRTEILALTNLEKAPEVILNSLEEAAFVALGPESRQLLIPVSEIQQLQGISRLAPEPSPSESQPLNEIELQVAASKSLSLSVNISDFLRMIKETHLQTNNDGTPRPAAKKFLDSHLATQVPTRQLWSFAELFGAIRPSSGVIKITSKGAKWLELDDLDRFIAIAFSWWKASPSWLRKTLKDYNSLAWDENLDKQLLHLFPLVDAESTLQQQRSEAALQGLIHNHRSTPWGAALWTETDPLPKISPFWPKYANGVIPGEDFTLLAAGPLKCATRNTLSTFSLLELGGLVPRYRITNDSILNALQSGYSAAEIFENLRSSSITKVPSNVQTLIEDVARRANGIRLKPTDKGSSLATRTSVLVEELLADPNLRVLALKRVNEREVCSPWSVERVLSALQSTSYTALLVDTDDKPVVPKSSSLDDTKSGDTENLLSKFEELVESVKTNTNFGIPTSIYTLLEVATEGRIPLELDLTLEDGSTKTIVVEPRSLSGARLRALEIRQSVERTFPVSCIRAVRSAEN